MKDKKIENRNYTCFFNLKIKKKMFIFFNGLAGVKNFYYDFPKYCKNLGYLFIDFPGFGNSFYIKKPKSIINHHIKILKKILSLNNIKKINLVIFSLSTSYLKALGQDRVFMDNVENIFLLDPSLEKKDLSWSLSLFKKKKFDYNNYILLYKKKLNYLFPMSLYKKKNYKNIIKQLIKFDSDVLYSLNKESIKIILNNKLLHFIKNKKTILIKPSPKRNFLYSKNISKIFYIEKSSHYLFLDNPRETYNILKNNV